jgi:predicted RND superfamily exporter protein
LIPAFSGGGIVNSSTVAKITSSPALVGESGSEMVLPTKMPNQTNKVSSNPKDVLMGNETTEIKASTGDNLSKTIEKNMELKKEASTSEALSDEKEKDENKGEKANNRTSSTKDTTDNLSRNPPGQAMIHTNLPSSTVEKLKTNLRSIPVWRTQHM